MISDEELEQLRYQGEGANLDFKQAQYPFSGATDHQKSELLKDILAMANAYRTGPGYILIGFKDQAPHPAEVVGIAPGEQIDDAQLQQFVGSKVDPLLEFQYEERIFEKKHVAVITIPKQPRPFALKKDYGKLEKNTVYVRRGSSTDEASMSELTKMALADGGLSRTACVDLQIENSENQPLPSFVTRAFYNFDKLPDYEEDNWVDMGGGTRFRLHSPRIVNRDYYREMADYLAVRSRVIPVRLSLTNQSDFALGEVKLELSCSTPSAERVRMERADELPKRPKSGDFFLTARDFRSVTEQLQDRVSIDKRGSQPICHILLGTLRPGETGRAEVDIAVLPSGPGRYALNVRILAREIAKPITKEHVIVVEGEIRQVGMSELSRLLRGAAKR